MRIKEAIQRIQSLYSKGVESDDTRLSERHIYNKLLSVRNELISKKMKSRYPINDFNYQYIPCIKMLPSPKYDCSFLPNTNCFILKSENPIPDIFMGINEEAIKYVMSIDGSISYSRTTYESLKYKKGSKYTSKTNEYFFKNKYLFITNRLDSTVISINAVFQDPIKAMLYSGDCGTELSKIECLDVLEQEFMVDSDLLDMIIKITAEELVILFSKNIEDKTNNTADSPPQQTK